MGGGRGGCPDFTIDTHTHTPTELNSDTASLLLVESKTTPHDLKGVAMINSLTNRR